MTRLSHEPHRSVPLNRSSFPLHLMLTRRLIRDSSIKNQTSRFVMGMVLGKVDVEEPPHEVLLTRTHPPAHTAYELRRYHERFAAETMFSDEGDDGSPFRLLAGYIGVFGQPQNEKGEAMAMTAPVVMEEKQGKAEAISMTAPVVKSQAAGGKEKMQFMLPAKYDSMDKIPKPTNPAVHIVELPPAAGAVHRFHGSYSMDRCHDVAEALVEQLKVDGVDLPEDAIETYQFWGYNPPFTIPFLRRNEVWIPLTDDQVNQLVNDFDPTAVN